MEMRDDGNGKNEKVAIYKTHCHPICYLKDVEADIIAHPGLIQCAAFSGQNSCNTCSHHWQQHLHVLYELKERTATVKDSEIEKKLRVHADDVTLRQTAITELEKVTEEYRAEHKQIQEAAAQFGIFLKKHSITPYNDKTLAHLDFMIKEERAKVEAGGNRKKLDGLEEDRGKHMETVKVLTLNMENNAKCQPLTEEGVDRQVKQLYDLKHFGKNLKAVKQTIASAHEATYRERPFRIGGKGPWAAQQPNHSTIQNPAAVRQNPQAVRYSTSMPMTMRPVSQQGQGGGVSSWIRNLNPFQ